MEAFQRSLLIDLDDSLAILNARVAPWLDDVDAGGHARAAAGHIVGLRGEIAHLLQDPALADHAQDGLHRQRLQHLCETSALLEACLITPLERFNEHDRRLTRLTALLARQVDWPSCPPPLVVASSDRYFFSLPALGLICVPARDSEKLLPMPDLVHEMAHMLLNDERTRGRLIRDFPAALDAHIAHATAAGHNLPTDLRALWLDHWLEEVVCDMVATYVVGPAFGHQHLRTIAREEPTAYSNTTRHPPDQARIHGVVTVLRSMRRPAEAGELVVRWSQYIETTDESPAADFRQAIPNALIQRLAANVVTGCRELRLRRFDARTVALRGDVVGMIQEAWQRFHRDPANYAGWEQARLGRFWGELGPRQSSGLAA